MPSLTVEHSERKAAKSRDAAEILKGNRAKATMIEMADHYAKLAMVARRYAAKPTQPDDSSTG